VESVLTSFTQFTINRDIIQDGSLYIHSTAV